MLLAPDGVVWLTVWFGILERQHCCRSAGALSSVDSHTGEGLGRSPFEYYLDRLEPAGARVSTYSGRPNDGTDTVVQIICTIVGMKQVSYSEARATLAKVLDTATDDLEEVVVTRAGHESVIVVSLREYEALKETAHLLGTPANARHLQRGLEEFATGGFVPGERLDVSEDDDSTGVA